MENERLLKQILCSKLCEGSCGIGRPKLTFKDNVKQNLKAKKISIALALGRFTASRETDEYQ